MKTVRWRSVCLGLALALGCTPTPTPIPITDVPASSDGAAKDAASADAPATTDSQVATDASTDAPPACPAEQISCGGACVNTATDPMHCGACGAACALANATPTCAAGRCAVGTCATGYADCDGDATNGCEVNLNESPQHCGACNTACTFANATGSCTRGTCGVGACNAGFGDCDGDAANGCETETATSTQNCGACGTACATTNGTASCAMGRCVVGGCDTGFGDCDTSATNGCEAPLNGNANCGMCGRACAAGTRCAAGDCVSSCPTGTTYCAELQICVSLSGDVSNCGMCGRACPRRANATSTCSGGECRIECAAGFGDCNNDPADGCEVNLATSAAHCGACGSACNVANATAGCAAGACTVASCAAGFGNCDTNPANGCEVNLNSTVNACGACGSACSLPNATPSCAAGRCAIATCNAGFLDCDTSVENGCETSGTTNTNCGACGTRCGSNMACSNGACVSTCPPSTTLCNGACVSTATDVSHCGGCGRVCPSYPNVNRTCMAGTCGGACVSGYGDCDRNTGNGCETNLTSSVTNCGACGNACALANANPVCAAGACAIRSCNVGFANCDGNASNGCEVNLATSSNNCGACGRTCATGQTCRLGVCRSN